MVSHELRTPLNAIARLVQLLRGPRRGRRLALAKGLEVIDRNARAQAKLIEDILDVSRIITGKLRLELAARRARLAIVRAALEVVRPPARPSASPSRFRRRRAPVTVFGDADRLQQVVWNLLSNAVKFTPGAAASSSPRPRRAAARASS